MSGEARTRWVVAMTAITMVVEIAAGVVYGSMALLADGLHMASHAAALGMFAFAYQERLGIAHLTVEVQKSRGAASSTDTGEVEG